MQSKSQECSVCSDLSSEQGSIGTACFSACGVSWGSTTGSWCAFRVLCHPAQRVMPAVSQKPSSGFVSWSPVLRGLEPLCCVLLVGTHAWLLSENHGAPGCLFFLFSWYQLSWPNLGWFLPSRKTTWIPGKGTQTPSLEKLSKPY